MFKSKWTYSFLRKLHYHKTKILHFDLSQKAEKR